MAFLLRQVVITTATGMLLFCNSCEKHPLSEMPEVQREQIDPAKKVWSTESQTDSEKSLSSPTPAEFFPESSHP
jgi:hypothetical protein